MQSTHVVKNDTQYAYIPGINKFSSTKPSELMLIRE